MDRRTFIRVVALGVLMTAGGASAQLRHGTPRVGVLHTSGRSELSLRVRGLIAQQESAFPGLPVPASLLRTGMDDRREASDH